MARPTVLLALAALAALAAMARGDAEMFVDEDGMTVKLDALQSLYVTRVGDSRLNLLQTLQDLSGQATINSGFDTSISGLEGRIETLEGSAPTITDNANRLGALEPRVGSIERTAAANYSQINNDIGDLAETVSGAQNNITLLQDAVSSLDESLGNTNGDVTSLSTRVGTLETSTAVMDAKNEVLAAVESLAMEAFHNATTLSQGIAVVASNISSLDMRVKSTESDITSINSMIGEILDCALSGQLWDKNTKSCRGAAAPPATCTSPADKGKTRVNADGDLEFCNGANFVAVGKESADVVSSCADARGSKAMFHVGTLKRYQLCMNGINYGGNGLTSANPGRSCASIFEHFGIEAAGSKRWVSANLEAVDMQPRQVQCIPRTGKSHFLAAKSCSHIKKLYPDSPSGAYWIMGTKNTPFEVFCEMDNNGGGWTMAAKVRGNDGTMNRNNLAQWSYGITTGGATNLADENSLTDGYNYVPFTDVMIRSIHDQTYSIGWRHPQTYQSIRSIIQSCTRVHDGRKLWGDVSQLHWHNRDKQPPSNFRLEGATSTRHMECQDMIYGFMVGDDFQRREIAGCPMLSGHAGGVVGVSIGLTYTHTYDRDDEYLTRCGTDFALGGGYADLAGNDAHAINQHWWGNGNEETNNWATHALFVRDPEPTDLYSSMVISAGDGVAEYSAGVSCELIKTHFPGSVSGTYFLPTGASHCDMSGSGVGADGSSAALAAKSCNHIIQDNRHRVLNDGAYFIILNGAAQQHYCDMTTEGGGWSLAVKVLGQNSQLNFYNTAQWRDGTLIGTASNLNAENAMTRGYHDLAFTDIMIRAVGSHHRRLAWRHPKRHASMKTVVNACKVTMDGRRLFGNVQNLGYSNSPNNGNFRECRMTRYGFFGGDDENQKYTVAGCTGIVKGHAGGVIGASVLSNAYSTRNYDADDSLTTRCVTDFAVGGGYGNAAGGDDTYAINAHWWGDGNSRTNAFDHHAVFVRDSTI